MNKIKVLLLILVGCSVVGLAILVLLPGKSQNQQISSPSTPKASTGENIKQKTPNTQKLAISFQENGIQNGKIVGDLVIENKSDIAYADLYYDVILQKTDKYQQLQEKDKRVITIDEGDRLAYQELKLGNLMAKEKKVLPLSFSFPTNINNGRYNLRTILLENDGTPISGSLNTVSLLGTGEVLTLKNDSCEILTEGQTFKTGDGPNVNPNGLVQAKCTFTNMQKKDIAVVPNVTYGVRYVVGYPPSQKQQQLGQEPIVFKTNETKDVLVALPRTSTPQVYQAYLSLINGKKEQLSVYTVFRWVVRGPSAYIRQSNLNQDYYGKGDTAKVSVSAGPSMDLYWRGDPKYKAPQGTDLTDAKLQVSLQSNGVECGKTLVDLPKGTSEGSWKTNGVPLTTNISVVKDCKNPVVLASVVSDNKTLATYKKPTVTNSNQTLFPTQLVVVILSILAVCAVAAYIITQKKKNVSPAPMLTVFGLCFFTGYAVFFYLLNTIDVNAFSINPPGQGNSLYISNGHTSMRGTFWLDGSSATQIGTDRFAIHFWGEKGNDGCGNNRNGYRISNFIGDATGGDGSFNTNNLRIENPNGDGNDFNITDNTEIRSISSVNNSSMSFDYTIVKDGGFDRNTDKTLRLDVDGVTVETVDGTDYFDYSRQTVGYNHYADTSGGTTFPSCNCIGRVEIPIDYTPDHITTTLSGRVVDIDTGNGIGGVSIDLCALGTVTTGADGYFRKPNVAQGTDFCIRATEKDGYHNLTSNFEFQKAAMLDLFKSEDKVRDDAFDFAFTKNPTHAIACTTAVNLTWNTVPGANSYDVTVNGIKSTVTGTSKTIPVAPNTTYTWSVQAVVSGQACNSSAASTFVIDACATSALGPLVIDAALGSGGVRQGSPNTTAKYKTSGLRDNQGGSNYYNALDITQRASADDVLSSQVKLLGTAFTEQGFPLQPSPTPSYPSNLQGLMDSARAANGFVLVHAGSTCNSCSAPSVSGKSFEAGNHYVYFNNGTWTWSEALESSSNQFANSSLEVDVSDADDDLNATFLVFLLQPIGNHNWGTVSYMLDSANQEFIKNQDPTP